MENNFYFGCLFGGLVGAVLTFVTLLGYALVARSSQISRHEEKLTFDDERITTSKATVTGSGKGLDAYHERLQKSDRS